MNVSEHFVRSKSHSYLKLREVRVNRNTTGPGKSVSLSVHRVQRNGFERTSGFQQAGLVTGQKCVR